MGIFNSKNNDILFDNNNFTKRNITKENTLENLIKKTDNIEIKRNNNQNEIINIEQNSYYTNSFDDKNLYDYTNLYDSFDEDDIKNVFAYYKVEFSTKSKTRHIIEKFNTNIN